MSTLSVPALQQQPAKQRLKSTGMDNWVSSAEWRPVAVLLRLASPRHHK